MVCDLVIRSYYIIFIHGKSWVFFRSLMISLVKGRKMVSCADCHFKGLLKDWMRPWRERNYINRRNKVYTESDWDAARFLSQACFINPVVTLSRVSCVAPHSDGSHTGMSVHSDVLVCFLQVLIAAFAASGYASTYFRAGSKPFNPVLGETYECIREDKGFRFFSEQVKLVPR